MVKPGELEPASTNVLRQTQFLGKPLLVNEPLMSRSAIAYSSDSPTAQSFAAYHPDIGHVAAKDGRRQELYLRLNKTSVTMGAYERALPPRGPTPPVVGQRGLTEHLPVPKVSARCPAIWPANDVVSKSGLFITPPTSPAEPQGQLPEVTTRRWSSTYDAYSPADSINAPLTSTDDASKRPLKHARASIAYKTYTGKPLPKPILTASVQDTDYDFIDMATPSPSPPSDSSSSSSSNRKFSFDADAPPDWQIIEASTQHTTPRARYPEDLTLRHSQTFIARNSANELYFTTSPFSMESQPSHPSPNLTTISPRRNSSPSSSPLSISITSLETIDSTTPPPQPTTRFYPSAILAHGRFQSRRKTPRGTVKLRSHADVEGEEFEMKEWREEPRFDEVKARKKVSEREEWRVW
ncbi:hypothetical protein PMZ80_003230 [Knufia obscura]|uniref:Uncharacterized protein n=2 Tax=Knufia TaxID=430999 RepID=A0AAN8IJM2_9EURO|nr:hypothetical protein PMZ80_003230 [Knufia obscura]KAK5950347.1 hypothetical protein OHC33_008566 [Knufia fluminis]